MPDEKEEIERRSDELVREYGRTFRGDLRRLEIFQDWLGCASALIGY